MNNKINYTETRLEQILKAHEKDIVEKIITRIEDSSINDLYLTIDAIKKEYNIKN